MRALAAALIFAAGLSAAQSATPTEKRIFIVASSSEGYGVDRCLAHGEPCGAAAAAAYCKGRSFAAALSFRQVDKDEITGAIPANGNECSGGACEQFVAIECGR